MKSRYTNVFGHAAGVCMLMAVQAGADVLELKNGQVLTGRYAGGTAGTIRFETAGNLRVIEASQALALTFTAAATPETVAAPVTAAPVTAAPVAAPVAAPADPTGSVVIPTSTMMMVRMIDGVSSKSPKGKRFAAVLETDLIVNGTMVSRAGAKVYGRIEQANQAGRFAGKSELDIRLCELTVGGALVPIRTGPYAQAGSRSMGKTVKGALLGTAIGAIADGSKGAGKGAAIGALASGLKPGQAIVVPPGTLLEFEIQQPVTVNPTR